MDLSHGIRISHWEVGGNRCQLMLSFLDVIEPENEFECTQFLLRINSTITRHQARRSDDEDTSEGLPTEETYCKEELELDLVHQHDESKTALAQTLISCLHIPTQVCESMVDKIVDEAFAIARDSYSYTYCNLLHIGVSINLLVDALGGLDESEPKFVAASKSSIDKLERTTVEASTECSICMEQIMGGSEATRMPCSHLFHEPCIVKWLEISRFCPLCRFPMSTEPVIDS